MSDTKQRVKTGRKAGIFYDQHTGLKVVAGQVVEVTAAQLNSKRVRAALNAGHLVKTDEKVTSVTTPTSSKPALVGNAVPTLDENKAKLIQLVNTKDIEVAEIAKEFTKPVLEELAAEFEIEVEANDTKATIVEALMEAILESDNE